MSQYTTEVRYICECAAGYCQSEGYESVNEIIKKAVPHIFDLQFVFPATLSKEEFCARLLKHYYLREIAFETVGVWKLQLNTRLCEIMPYYYPLYLNISTAFNPLNETELTRSHTLVREERGNGASQQNTQNTSTQQAQNTQKQDTKTTDSSQSTNQYSDTPQGGLTNVKNGKYLTNATVQEDSTVNMVTAGSESDTTSTVNSKMSQISNTEKRNTATDEFIEKVAGRTTGAGKQLAEYSQALFNIDTRVMNDLSDLFFTLY